MNELRKKQLEKRHYRRSWTDDITIPEQTVSLREVLNRTANGQPLNVKIRQHRPLPAVNPSEDDYTTDTEEITDLTDAMSVAQRVTDKMDEMRSKKQEDARKKRDEELEREVQRRVSEALASKSSETQTGS